jgi:hypothetical protein
LDDHLEKLFEGSFSPKSLFLVFRKNMKSLLEMLLVLSGFNPLSPLETTSKVINRNPNKFRDFRDYPILV